MKTVCELCGGTRLLPFNETFKGVDIVGCTSCGLVWNRNMAQESEQLEFYQEQNRAQGVVSRPYLLSMLARAAGVTRFLGGTLKPGMKHLDVGCAEGTLLALTRSHGLEVQGLEVDVNYSRFARETRGLEVFPNTLEDAPIEKESLDLISFVHVVEHLFHPVQVLATARELLRPDGLLFVEVPNMDQPLPGRRRFFRPLHNFYFTANTLRAVVAKAGFTPLRIGYNGRDGSVQVLAARSRVEQPDLSPFRDDARRYKAKVSRERYRAYLIVKMLFTHLLPQEWHKRRAWKLYGEHLPEIQAAPKWLPR
jgi:2-polyprenyl-3-methyl-5-hydroxy-6-metoxy-1,4-benzoquinol methylase